MNSMNMSVLANMQFRPVENMVWAMPSGNLGMKTNDGILTFIDGALENNPNDIFSMSVPAFAFATKLEDISKGDIVLASGGELIGWVMDNNDGLFEVIDAQGKISKWSPVKTKVFGFESDGPLVVRSISNINSGTTEGTGFNANTLMQLTMMKSMLGDDANIDEMVQGLVPFMAFQNNDGSDMNSMLQTMMMMNLVKNNGMTITNARPSPIKIRKSWSDYDDDSERLRSYL